MPGRLPSADGDWYDPPAADAARNGSTGTDLVVGLREIGEQLRQQRVDAPLHVAIGVEQLALRSLK